MSGRGNFLDDYEPVSARLEKFWADHPHGRVLTELVDSSDTQVIVKAALYRVDDSEPFATGLAHEVPGQGNVNRTSALENCETSAIGRALANGGYASKGAPRPSQEEMGKTTGHRSGEGGPPCAKCGEPVTGEAVRHSGQTFHSGCVPND